MDDTGGSEAEPAGYPTGLERTDYVPAGNQEHFIVPLLRRQIEEMIGTYGTRPDSGQALDVGCGGQPFRHMLESLGYAYTGLDVNQNPEGSVDVLAAIDEQLPPSLGARGPFDLVLCTEVLEHVADWDAAFRNLASLMAGGGRLVITCPFFYPLHQEPYDFWRPTTHALQYFAARVGLTVVEQRKVGDSWDALGTLIASSYVSTGDDDRWVRRAVARSLEAARLWFFRLLCSRKVRRALGLVGGLQGPMYLSNVVVLERRPATADGTP